MTEYALDPGGWECAHQPNLHKYHQDMKIDESIVTFIRFMRNTMKNKKKSKLVYNAAHQFFKGYDEDGVGGGGGVELGFIFEFSDLN